MAHTRLEFLGNANMPPVKALIATGIQLEGQFVAVSFSATEVGSLQLGGAIVANLPLHLA